MEFWKNIILSVRAMLGYKIEQQEDPVKLTEQSIRELKVDLSESLKSLAEAKAGFIRAKRETDAQNKMANDYERKAVLLLEKAKSGELDAQTADNLALQALAKKDEIVRRVSAGASGLTNYEGLVRQLESQTMKIKNQIETWENELRTLKARARISEATKSLHEKLSRFDSGSTANLLETIKEKTIEQEALAESYSHLSTGKTTWENEVDKILGLDKPANNPNLSSALDQLKQNVNSPDYKPVVKQAPIVNQPKDVPPPSSLLSELEKLKSKLKE